MSRVAAAWAGVALAWAALAAAAAPAAARPAEDELRALWVGRWVVLRTAAMSNCDERYTDNRMRGPLPDSGGRHGFDPGELGRVDALHLQRARIDLLVTLGEPLRVELRDGPFQLYEQLECRVELELPAPRDAVRQGAVDELDGLIGGVLERHEDRSAAAGSPRWNGRQVEPLPADHDDRLAAYHAWKAEQLALAVRDRLAEALDRAADIAGRADRSAAYARGLVRGLRDADRNRFYSADCAELPGLRFSPRRGKPPEEIDESDGRRWRDGYEDGQRLLFEIALARRLERCLG